MCTVTFIPAEQGVYLTSNRDEKAIRQPASPPERFQTNDNCLLYPKDQEKGGTWVAVAGNGSAAVLLNGALQQHQPELRYTSSRGFVIPQVLACADALQAFTNLHLGDTEPFTLILYWSNRLYECQWNGMLKSIHEHPVNEAHIWASTTLYTAPIIQKRKDWFQSWLKQHPLPDRDSVISFHRFTGDGDVNNDLVINRQGETQTVSITSICLEKKCATMEYLELSQQKRYRQILHLPSRGHLIDTDKWKRFLIRAHNWEYWPFHLIYIPVYFYYFYLSIKARSLFFFNAANPTIRHGGFLMESKKEIYDLLPQGTYPTTILVPAGALDVGTVEHLLELHKLHFPLIAKPDIGLRGLGVKKIHCKSELVAYNQLSEVDYLLQAFVPYTKEVGVFYYREPGERQGNVTGLVGKELLSITGDGVSTIETLLTREERFFLQLPALRKQLGVGLTEVLLPGEERLIVPFGNHSRGTKFVDITDQLTSELFDTLDTVCKAVPGFYFGRLDIKYDNWEDLCRGKHFWIIELNGAGSEPAHIYDPKHSLLFAWKEITRHLHILYQVSKKNKAFKKQKYLSLKDGMQLFRENSAYMDKIA